jgi:tetraacyldisaccharide-1-P 4'-kinase
VPFLVESPRSILPGGEAFDPARHDPALLVTAIARPERFRESLRAFGVEPKGSYIEMDHGRFARETLLARLPGMRSVVTTSKDYWRDPEVFADLTIPVFIPAMDVALSDADLAGILAGISN